MAREGREVWSKRVARWRDSGLSAKEFAAETGIRSATLSHWAWKLGSVTATETAERKASRRVPEGRVEWVEVAPPLAAEHESATVGIGLFELVLGTRVVRVPPDFDSEALRRLLAVLEASR
jgi:hypothetical protein